MIRPEDLIQELSLEGLNRTSDAYFRNLPDPLKQMGKPFSMPETVAHSLDGLAMILSGLKLSRTMSVVDFGAGTCWLTRYLLQMGCAPIAVDVSERALALGQRLIEEYPICGRSTADPQFLTYDGRTINLPDNSVDRIICFDSFHHVPNQEEVLREFYRILKPSGIAGFHEPGLGHSATVESQKEMREFQVLENDVDKWQIRELWRSIGPGEFRAPVHCGLDLVLDEKQLRGIYEERDAAESLLRHILEVNRIDNIFFLSKGEWLFDSRSRDGLRSRLELIRPPAPAGDRIAVSVLIENTGRNRWLASTPKHYGTVTLGMHLVSEDGAVLKQDCGRWPLPHDVRPGEVVNMSISFPKPDNADLVELDLVSEQVCWFADHGSSTLRIRVPTS